MSEYQKRIHGRSYLHYLAGLLIRWRNHFKYDRAVRIARKNGATIGEGVVMPIGFAKKCNKYVTIGNHVSIQTDNLTRIHFPFKIGNNVIIGNNVKFALGGHNTESTEFEPFRPYKSFEIEDYAWICNDSVITPTVKKIGKGAVLGTNAVLFQSIKPMSIAIGNPAKVVSERTVLHTDLVVESLLGGDYRIYKETYKNRNK